MFRAATSLADSRAITPPVFTGTIYLANSTLGSSRNLDRGRSIAELQTDLASVDHFSRSQRRNDLHCGLGAVTFPAKKPPKSIGVASGTAEHNESGREG